MSIQNAGGFITTTALTVSTTSAKGIWTVTQHAQYTQLGVWPTLAPPPTIGTVTIDGTTASIPFTAPSGSYGITGYIATSTPGGYLGTITGAGNGTITVSGLTVGISYTFTVASINQAGVGVVSSASNLITTLPSAPAWPVTNIGDAYEGGYFAGQLKVSGVYYNLIVAPASTGQSMSTFGPAGTTGATSSINGSANTATISALGASYTAARFCKNLTIGGYTDWYLPAINEQELLYFYFKGNLYDNDTYSGANVNAVPPEPINTNYTASYPARTTIAAFLNTEWFISGGFWTSTEYDATFGIYFKMDNGAVRAAVKDGDTMYYRAVRKVLAT